MPKKKGGERIVPLNIKYFIESLDPWHSKDQRNTHPYYRNGNKNEKEKENKTRYIDSDVNLKSSFSTSFFNHLFHNENSNCLFVCLENLAVQPNSEKVNNLFQSLENSNCFCLFVCLEILSLGGLMPACRPEGLPEGLQF